MKPEELVAYLDDFVIQQDDAKAVLATKICTHFNRIRYLESHPELKEKNVGHIKSNVLLVGPTGVGKTYLIKLIADRLGVPFVKGDATKFSETGYVGADVEDLVRDLVRQADGDIERARYGIIYVDEVDKIASSQNRFGADVSRTGVQRALLKPMEETDVDLKVPHDPISQIEALEHYRATGKREKRVVNTKNILFVMSGAFEGLDKIVKQRTQQQGIGFERSISTKKEASFFFKKIKAEDLIEFGFESEFVGRLPIVAVLHELSVDDLYQILLIYNSSLVVGKKQDFQAYGIRILFEDSALKEIAGRAAGEQTGARGLVSVMERTLLRFEKKLPSTDLSELAVTLEIVQDPEGELKKLLVDPKQQEKNRKRFEGLAALELERLKEVIIRTSSDYLEEHEVSPSAARISLMARYCQEKSCSPRDVSDIFIYLISLIQEYMDKLSEKCGLHVVLSEEAVDRILSARPCNERTVSAICEHLITTYEYGLSLMIQKKGAHEVIIPPEGIDSPKEYIDELVSRTFKL